MMRIAVIKFCAGYDRQREDRDYSDNKPIIGPYKDRGPTGWHSYAAATNGFVLLYNNENWIYDKILTEQYDLAILCVDNWLEPIDTIASLINNRNIPVMLGLHEGMYNLEILLNISQGSYFQHLIELTNTIEPLGWLINIPQQTKFVWEEIQRRTNVPMFDVPYCWDIKQRNQFIVPIKERKGIFCAGVSLNTGTPRNSFYNLLLASRFSNKYNIPVSWLSRGNGDAYKYIKQLFDKPNLLTIYDEDLPYPDWLHMLASHRIVLNLDTSLVQGQIPGDCAFVSVPCVGGNSRIQEFMFPKYLCKYDMDLSASYDAIKNLLLDDKQYSTYIKGVIEDNIHKISFETTVNLLQHIKENTHA